MEEYRPEVTTAAATDWKIIAKVNRAILVVSRLAIYLLLM